MKKSVTALTLFGVALIAGAGTTVRARAIERNVSGQHDLAFEVRRDHRLNRIARERLSRDDYDPNAAREDVREDVRERLLAADRRIDDSDRDGVDARLRADARVGFVSASDARVERSREADGRSAESERAPGNGPPEASARGDGGNLISALLRDRRST